LLSEAAAGSVSFVVNPDGTVSYDSALEGILAGQGTSQLTVNGATVTINAQALTDPYLVLDYYTDERPGTFQAHLLPGNHLLSEAAAGSISFVVNPDGTVSYDSALEGILTGQGTSQLTVNGATVIVNAQALTTTQVYVDNYTSEATAAPFVLHLLPGQHQLQGASGGSLTFTVNPDGTVSFPASEDSLLSLQGQADLIVKALS
jgi:hypothetical protein